MEEQSGNLLAFNTQERFLEELRGINTISSRFGLHLSEKGMLELALARERALTDHGRVELGASAILRIIDGFCDSPFLQQEEYETSMLELTDAFYYFKNECGDQLSDDELIAAMRERYDAYDGSTEAVVGTSLESLCRARRLGMEYEDGWEDEESDDE